MGSDAHAEASDAEVHSGSDASVDRIVQYTGKGKKRATSEARRAWNYICDFEGCGQRFNRPCRLESHKRTHTKERPFACDREGCGRTFPRKDHLQRHITHFHAELARSHVCDWDGCGKTFTSNGRLQRHKEIHESKFYCTSYPPCKEAFRKQKTLDAHIKTIHLAAKAYPCTFVDSSGIACSYGYLTEASLRRHVSNAHGNRETHRFYCMLCYTPGTESELSQVANDDTMPKEPLSFSTATELHAHGLAVHPPTCSACGQVFKNKWSLDNHFKVLHTNPNPHELFQCPYEDCGRIFNRKSNMTTHINQVHEKQYRFACTQEAVLLSKYPELSSWNGWNACGKLLKTKAALEQHVRTHHLRLPNRKETRKARKRLIPDPTPLSMLTGIGYEEGRPITCFDSDCPRRFARDRDLHRHMVAEHGYTDADTELFMLERDAANGGQFWIGGLDDFEPMSMASSTDPSLPHTPLPYFGQQDMDFKMPVGDDKTNDIPVEPALMDANPFGFGSMDTYEGVAGFTAGSDPQDGVDPDLLDKLQQYNDQRQGRTSAPY